MPEIELAPDKIIEKEKRCKKIKLVTSSSEFGTQKPVEIDPRPFEGENTKKSTP